MVVQQPKKQRSSHRTHLIAVRRPNRTPYASHLSKREQRRCADRQWPVRSAAARCRSKRAGCWRASSEQMARGGIEQPRREKNRTPAWVSHSRELRRRVKVDQRPRSQ